MMLVYILPGKKFELIRSENELETIRNSPNVTDAYIVVYNADEKTKANYEGVKRV